MSYDISLTDPVTGSTLTLDHPHQMRGGTYAVGGTREAWINVTYNYSAHFRRVLGDEGIRSIYGMTGEQSIPVLGAAIAQLGEDVADDYWKPTEGNARIALLQLRSIAALAPHGIWKGD